MDNFEERILNLIQKAEKLNEQEKAILRYFLSNVSVGDIRAVLDLKTKGIDEPERVITKLIDEGFLEKGEGCYNLVKELRSISIRKKLQI